jgi:hypothetical protein
MVAAVAQALAQLPAQKDVAALDQWSMPTSDDLNWAKPDFDDSGWKPGTLLQRNNNASSTKQRLIENRPGPEDTPIEHLRSWA